MDSDRFKINICRAAALWSHLVCIRYSWRNTLKLDWYAICFCFVCLFVFKLKQENVRQAKMLHWNNISRSWFSFSDKKSRNKNNGSKWIGCQHFNLLIFNLTVNRIYMQSTLFNLTFQGASAFRRSNVLTSLSFSGGPLTFINFFDTKFLKFNSPTKQHHSFFFFRN